LLEKPVFPNQIFRLFVIRQQAVYQFVTNGNFSSFENTGSYLPFDPLHKNLVHPPQLGHCLILTQSSKRDLRLKCRSVRATCAQC
jgi:hypothetical protein